MEPFVKLNQPIYFKMWSAVYDYSPLAVPLRAAPFGSWPI
jgi:hypothetical protein